jgi:cell wall-associated NlpC family hydrolase
MNQCEIDSRHRVVREALEWLHTPYHHHGRVKHVGVDCAQLLCCVYEAAGVVEPVHTGHYPTDWHLHRSEEMFLAWLERVGAWRTAVPNMGDLAVFRFGRTYSHGAIMIEDDLALHAYINQRVMLTRLNEEPLLRRKVYYYTLWGSVS